MRSTRLYVSLHKRWANQMQLETGRQSLVDSATKRFALYLLYDPIRKARKIVLDTQAQEPGRFLKRRIVAAYVGSFDNIQMKAEKRFTDEQHNIILEITEALFGLEVTEVASIA